MDEHLKELLLPVAIIGTFGLTLSFFIKTLTDYFLRKKMVEKGLVGVDANELLRNQEISKFASLKWGLIVLFGGIGLIILEAIPYEKTSTLPFGIFAISLSLGFLTYFILARKLAKE